MVNLHDVYSAIKNRLETIFTQPLEFRSSNLASSSPLFSICRELLTPANFDRW
jgi:hypothetical protein